MGGGKKQNKQTLGRALMKSRFTPTTRVNADGSIVRVRLLLGVCARCAEGLLVKKTPSSDCQLTNHTPPPPAYYKSRRYLGLLDSFSVNYSRK